MIITWARWLLFGKNLNEILAGYEKMQTKLENFNSRTHRRMVKEERRAARLKARVEQRVKDIDRSNLVHHNFHVLLTQQIGVAPQETPAE